MNQEGQSVGTLLEKKAAERREELRKKEKERRKKSRGRSRSRKIRKGNKRKGESSSERRHIREPGGVRSAPSLGHRRKESPSVDGKVELRERAEEGRKARGRKLGVERVYEQEPGQQIGNWRRKTEGEGSSIAIPGSEGAVPVSGEDASG